MVRTGEAASAEATGGKAEIPAILLDHHIGSNLGRAKQGVLGLVDGKILGDAIGVGRIGIVPSGFQFSQGDGIGPVAIDFIGGHVDKGSFRTGLAGRFEKIQGPDGVGIKIVEGDGRGAVVGRLGGGVDDGVRFERLEELKDAGPVPDVEFVVLECSAQGPGQSPLIPAGVPLGPEKYGTLVVIHTMDVPAQLGKMDANFRTDQAGGTGDEEG